MVRYLVLLLPMVACLPVFSQEPQTENEKAINAIQALGGKVTRDFNLPVHPVVQVNLSVTQITDASVKAEKPNTPRPSDKPEKPEKLTQPSIDYIAKEYYKEVGLWQERDKVASDRSNHDMWKPPPANPRVATGTVTDRFGQRVAGAEVLIKTETGDQELGRGKTDDQGNFRLELSTTIYKGLMLDVTASGFTRWGLSGIYGGIVDQPVRMDRQTGAAYFEALAVERDTGRRIRLLLELVGSRQLGPPELRHIYAQIGLVRNDLITVIRSKAFEDKDDKLESPANRARNLLVFWQDEADAELINQYVAAHTLYQLRKDGPSGATLDEACRKYADAHFAGSQKTEHGFSEPIYGPDQDRALLEFTVRYAFWGYSNYVVLTKRNGQWTVKLECEHMHFDIKPVEPR